MNIKVFFTSIKYILEQLVLKVIVRIYSIPIYETVVKVRLVFNIKNKKAKSKEKLLLEILEDIYISLDTII